jgi:hypothetical protein
MRDVYGGDLASSVNAMGSSHERVYDRPRQKMVTLR